MKLLDLFCGAGGCSVGYHRAGFTEIVGVDNRPMPRYPFEFVQADALTFLKWLVDGHGFSLDNPGPLSIGKHWNLSDFDAIHASPPCQDFCALKHFPGVKKRGNLIEPTRELLTQAAKPWIIENVPGSPLQNPIVLCGKMFDLKVYRHRLFESNILLFGPSHIPHRDNCRKHTLSKKGFVSVIGNGGMGVGKGGHAYARKAMGIDWMSRKELSQAIPPAYCEFIGRQMLNAMGAK